jgi:transcription initiation factor IIE alpha subunit
MFAVVEHTLALSDVGCPVCGDDMEVTDTGEMIRDPHIEPYNGEG